MFDYTDQAANQKYGLQRVVTRRIEYEFPDDTKVSLPSVVQRVEFRRKGDLDPDSQEPELTAWQPVERALWPEVNPPSPYHGFVPDQSHLKGINVNPNDDDVTVTIHYQPESSSASSVPSSTSPSRQDSDQPAMVSFFSLPAGTQAPTNEVEAQSPDPGPSGAPRPAQEELTTPRQSDSSANPPVETASTPVGTSPSVKTPRKVHQRQLKTDYEDNFARLSQLGSERVALDNAYAPLRNIPEVGQVLDNVAQVGEIDYLPTGHEWQTQLYSWL